MRIPFSAGVISDATKIKNSGSCDDLFELEYLPVITDNFSDLSGWTESDSGSNVNLAGGVVTMNGNGTWNGNGLRRTITQNNGFLEVKMSIDNAVDTAYSFIFGINNADAIANGPIANAAMLSLNPSFNANAWSNGADTFSQAVIVANTYYRLRIYIQKASTGAFRWVKFTILGGIYTTEKVIHESAIFAYTVGAPFYVHLSRYANASTRKVNFKEFRRNALFATDAPYVDFVSDAGISKLHYGVNFTNLALPTNVISTNLEFAYSYDNGTPSYSGKYTLANLIALGSISGAKRYLRIRIYANSNGETQTYIAPINADDAVASIQSAGASAPGAFTLSVIEWGANRARLSWTPSAGAMTYGIYRDTVLIDTISDNFFYIDKPTAGTISYYVKATNATGSTDSNAVSIDIGLGGIERRAWTYFKSTMQADSDLSAYITKWKFNKTEEQFTPALCPLFVAYVEGIEQGAYMGVPKQRTDTVLIKVSGKVASEGDNADNELLKIDEMIRNALEKTLQLAPAWFTVSFGNSSFVWLNDRIQEVNIDVRLALPRFTSGTR